MVERTTGVASRKRLILADGDWAGVAATFSTCFSILFLRTKRETSVSRDEFITLLPKLFQFANRNAFATRNRDMVDTPHTGNTAEAV